MQETESSPGRTTTPSANCQDNAGTRPVHRGSEFAQSNSAQRSARRTPGTACGNAVRNGLAALIGAMFAVVGCSVDGPGDSGQPVPGERAVAVPGYCASFAHAYAAQSAVDLDADSVRVEAGSAVGRWMSNLFQPTGSRFLSGHRCTFETASSKSGHHTVSVDILVAETRAFAEHTQWEDLQIVPIRRVVDEASDRAGYGVFKYLRRD